MSHRRQRYSVWAEQWFDLLDLKPKTVANYRTLLDLRVLPYFGRMPIGEIMPLDIEKWLKEMERDGVSPSRRRQALHVLSGSLRKALVNSMIPTNPASAVKAPRIEKTEITPLTVSEIKAIADRTPEAHRTLIYVLGYGGLRIGEAVALRRRSVDLAACELTITESVSDVNGHLEFVRPKNDKPRTVSMPPFLRDMMAVHLDVYARRDVQALVFTDGRGGVLRADNFRKREFYPAVEAAGIGRHVRVHDLRHTAASLLIQQGIHPKVVQDHLGHSSISVTMDRYGHIYDADRSKAAEALQVAFSENA
jgi:integrase